MFWGVTTTSSWLGKFSLQEYIDNWGIDKRGAQSESQKVRMVNDQVKESNKMEEKMRNVAATLKTHEEIDRFKEERELVAVLETDKDCY